MEEERPKITNLAELGRYWEEKDIWDTVMKKEGEDAGKTTCGKFKNWFCMVTRK